MQGIRKKFSQDLYNKNDEVAKIAVTNYLKKIYSIVIIRPENYNADILVIPFIEPPFLVEAGIKYGWLGNEFPKNWPDVQIESRKDKYLNENLKVFYFILSKDLKRAFVVDGINLKEEFLKEVPNKYVSNGEYFYKIPIKLGKFIDL